MNRRAAPPAQCAPAAESCEVRALAQNPLAVIVGL